MPYSVTERFISWLSALGYTATTYPAKGATGTYVTVERTGGGVVDLVDRPEIAIQIWADTAADAEATANEIRNRIALGERPAGVFSAFVNTGPYPFYDESTDKPRYQIVLDCTSRITE